MFFSRDVEDAVPYIFMFFERTFLMNENQENQIENAAPAEEEQDINILKKDRLDKLAALREGGCDPFTVTKYDVTGHAAEYKAQYEAKEAELIAEANGDEEKLNASLEALHENTVRIAGRIMSWRDMGKANFIDVRDSSDRIQVYIRSNDIGADLFKEFKKKWDIGDIIGVEGFVFRTRKGEISIHAKKIELLSKSLLPLPEKWHGLKDTDTRYRQLSEAAKNMQEKANEAREYINKYFKRKNKELWNNAKSKERMGYMSKALEEINKADKQITDEKKVTDSIVTAEYEKRQELIKAEKEKNAAREAEIAAQKQEILKAKQEEELKKQELEKTENAKKAAEAAKIENMKKTDPIGARIRQYKADSAEHMKARDKNPNLGTVAENAALVAAESIEELDKLSKNNALTPEQKKEAVTHIARVFAYDNEMFTQSKNVSKNEFKQTVRPLAESNFFQSSLGDITPDSLKSFCTTPKKSVELKGQLHANGGEERLRHEVAANKKKMLANDKTAKREALKKKNEEIDNLRLNAPSLKDKRHTRTRSNTITKKPKPMGG